MAVKTVTASSSGEGKHINNHQNISTTQFLSWSYVSDNTSHNSNRIWPQ